ncbi:hypothetical protein L1987_77985 [Smallanthus sonchifolius]|uniref:Uncharacterized protein n=1 Tax=Smallanthus sonchifolius TaxID=185202 RepID=A0ACB8ZCE9_9ASTR|nr:hypothetical protein L1987_77985 [Smallanthus sonchifolius]
MPTLTTIALENLFRRNNSSTLKHPQYSTNQEQDTANNGFEVQSGGIGEDELVESCLFGEWGEFETRSVVDSLSVASSSELNDSGWLGFENMSVVSNQIGEFYDAAEDLSSDGSVSSVASCSGNIELEFYSTKINLLVDIDRRKAAEDDVADMCSHWHRIRKFLLPHSSSNDSSPTTRFDINVVKQLFEEVVVARFVTEAMGKAEAKAETELAAQLIIMSKDKEISRLRDRLQYYETMIHEMSQNNLESMEVARRHRERRRGRRKWLWSCIGMSMVIGASVIAYLYAPRDYLLENVGDTQPEAANG